MGAKLDQCERWVGSTFAAHGLSLRCAVHSDLQHENDKPREIIALKQRRRFSDYIFLGLVRRRYDALPAACVAGQTVIDYERCLRVLSIKH
jgi:hypothetical protein